MKFRDHLPILRCPLSKQGLREMEISETVQLNESIERRECRHHDGTTVLERLDAESSLWTANLSIEFKTISYACCRAMP